LKGFATMLDRVSTVLVVIDIQERLLPKIDAGEAVARRAVTLIQFARELELPILCTEQYPKGLGPTVEPVREALGDVAPIEKTSFGCMGDDAFVQALDAIGRNQLLVTGIEAHVCVMQTVLPALAAGREVYVPRDAVGSRKASDYSAGLARMEKAGAALVTTEMAMFEVLREAGTPEFKRVLPLIK
jgi:nicotinamidase-related amidase